MANFELHGETLVYGFLPTDAPNITNFITFKAELTYEPEVYAQAQDGEGHTLSVAVSKAEHRKITGTFTGYIAANTSGNNIGNTFTFDVNGVTRFFIIKSISDPREKGAFAEVSLSVESYKGISA